MAAVSQSTAAKQSRLEPEVYSLADFAKLCGCSYTMFHQMAQANSLPVEPLMFGRVRKFPKSAVHAFLKINEHAERDSESRPG